MTESTNNNSVTYSQKKRGKENRRQSISRKRNGASITKMFPSEKHIHGIVQNNKIAEAKQVFNRCKSINFCSIFLIVKLFTFCNFPFYGLIINYQFMFKASLNYVLFIVFYDFKEI